MASTATQVFAATNTSTAAADMPATSAFSLFGDHGHHNDTMNDKLDIDGPPASKLVKAESGNAVPVVDSTAFHGASRDKDTGATSFQAIDSRTEHGRTVQHAANVTVQPSEDGAFTGEQSTASSTASATATGAATSSTTATAGMTPSKRKRNKRIPRPMNSFMVFAKEYRKKLQEENPMYDNKIISKLLGAKWAQLTPDEKQVYNDEAKRLAEEHRIKYPDWKFTRDTSKRKRKAQQQERQQDNTGAVSSLTHHSTPAAALAHAHQFGLSAAHSGFHHPGAIFLQNRAASVPVTGAASSSAAAIGAHQQPFPHTNRHGLAPTQPSTATMPPGLANSQPTSSDSGANSHPSLPQPVSASMPSAQLDDNFQDSTAAGMFGWMGSNQYLFRDGDGAGGNGGPALPPYHNPPPAALKAESDAEEVVRVRDQQGSQSQQPLARLPSFAEAVPARDGTVTFMVTGPPPNYEAPPSFEEAERLDE